MVSGHVIATPGAPGSGDDDGEQTYVFGFPVEDDEIAPVVRKVLQLSFAAGILVVVSQIAKYETRKAENFQQNGRDDDVGSLIMNIMIGLMVPACGYFGAKDRNRSLLSCFYGWSICQAICSMMTVLVVGSIVMNGGAVTVQEYEKNGQGSANPDGVHIRESTVHVPMSVAVTAFLVALVTVVLSCLQFYYGGRLLESDYFHGNHDLAHAPVFETRVVPAHQVGGPQHATGGIAGIVPGQPVVGQPFTGTQVVPPPPGGAPMGVPMPQQPGVASTPYSAQPTYAYPADVEAAPPAYTATSVPVSK